MKALSLKQPWAELIVSGKKTIETRTWRTKHRGEFLIHASKQVDKEGMKKFGYAELPTGVIVGRATLIDVKSYENKKEFDKDVKKHLVKLKKWDKKRYGYYLKNIKRVKPKQVKGQLNFFEVK